MNHYFEILELRPGATPDEVKTAYRDLAKVWHPDRFKDDSPRLKAKAAEKLAEINEAYEKIRTYQARQRARKQGEGEQGSNTSQAYTGYRPYTPGTSPGAGESFSGYERPTNGRTHSQTNPFSNPYSSRPRRPRDTSRARHGSSGRSASNRTSSTRKVYRGSAYAAYNDVRSSDPSQTLARSGRSMKYNPYSRSYTYYRERKKRRRSRNTTAIYLTIVGILVVAIAGAIFYIKQTQADGPLTLSEWPVRVPPESDNGAVPAGEAQQEEANATTETTDSANSAQPPVSVYEPPQRINEARHAGGPVDPGFFTLGSSKEEVVQMQGEPEQVRHGVFRYGFSSVFFENDEVVGWHQSPGTQLNVQLRPRKSYGEDYFTVGSSRDQVIAVAGTPDHYGDGGRELRYGESRVTFQRGRVVSWHMNTNSPLSARLVPQYPSDADFFTLGSSKDEVLSVQGTPDHFSENSFHYGHSMIHFTSDRVTGWNEATNYPLEVKLLPSMPTSSKYFTLGSSRDEVIAAQGTPDQYSERMLKYGYSTVSFENGYVVSWYQSAASPLNVRSDQ